MRSAVPRRSFAAAALACALTSGACSSRRLGAEDGGSGTVTAGTAGAGTVTGSGGSAGPASPCLGASDPRLVVAPSRNLLLTSRELLNMVRYLTDDTEAEALRASGVFPFATDYATQFPPAVTETFTSIPDDTAMSYFTAVANHVARYAVTNLPSVTACLAAANDACAGTALLAFAQKAFRRPLEDGERSNVVGIYTDAVSSGGARDEAARKALSAVLASQPFLYRSELGDATRPSASPAGLPLTSNELASALSFFLTDDPPDDTLLAAAQAGHLTADTLPAQVDRLLATPAARAWLDKVMEIYFRLNRLPGVIVDAARYPEATPQLYADMQTEGRLFLDATLWNSTLDDLLTSRTTFINATLAQTIYRVPVPAGATATDFVLTTMPASERSGLVTLPGFVAVLGGIVFEERGIYVSSLLTGMDLPPHSNEIQPSVQADFDAERSGSEAVAQIVADRASKSACAGCHVHCDPYAVVLESYDEIGRFRTVDDAGRPIDSRTTLPPEVGGGQAATGGDLAAAFSGSNVFAATMAQAMLRYALGPAGAGADGCAVADINQRWQNGPRTFSGLVRAIALSPAFRLRAAAP